MFPPFVMVLVCVLSQVLFRGGSFVGLGLRGFGRETGM